MLWFPFITYRPSLIYLLLFFFTIYPEKPLVWLFDLSFCYLSWSELFHIEHLPSSNLIFIFYIIRLHIAHFNSCRAASKISLADTVLIEMNAYRDDRQHRHDVNETRPKYCYRMWAVKRIQALISVHKVVSVCTVLWSLLGGSVTHMGRPVL